jgi:signal peptidase I
VAKLSVTSYGTIVGEMLTKNGISQYSDLWGFKHFAMARLLTAEQIETLHPGQLKHLSNTPLYLELTHHPSLKEAPLIRDEFNRIRPDLHTSVSLLPLNQQQIITLSNHMLTCRFVVENGFAHRYGSSPKQTSYLPSLPDVPDGTYEIEEGKAYKIGIGGIATELEPNHPLYRKDPATIQLLYNLGIEFITYYNPSKNSHLYPSRYAYFRNQDLYLLGVPVVKKEEPELTLFLQREYQRQSSSLSGTAYLPFDDAGPPLLQDGSLDVSFIRKYGIRVPDKMYLALGDNHAMSADSRQFGFVPEDNIRGGASFLFWPPGPRWGQPFQPTFPHLTFPNLLVWGIALSVGGIYFFYTRKKRNQNIQF